MGDVMEKRAESERQAAELDDFDIAIGSGPNAILALRRKGGNQVETFQIATERLRTACRVLTIWKLSRSFERFGSSFLK